MRKYKLLGQMPGNASLFAGSSAGHEGTADGSGDASRFHAPQGIEFAADGTFALVAGNCVYFLLANSYSLLQTKKATPFVELSQAQRK
jgi:hypothetical protein